MIGDIILWLRRIKKELFCIHEYEIHFVGTQFYESCKKCGRSKYEETNMTFAVVALLFIGATLLGAAKFLNWLEQGGY